MTPSAQELRADVAATTPTHENKGFIDVLAAKRLRAAGYADSPAGRELAERVAEAMEILEAVHETKRTGAERRALAVLRGETT